MKISKSKTFKDEYCATIVQIGNIEPIEGKDRIVKTIVNGLSIVIGKADFKTGDYAVYCANETVINPTYLKQNSMYDIPSLNADTTKRGYINKAGRLRLIKLGGVPSYGMLLPVTSIARFVNESIEDVTDFLASHVGEDFDEINKERFIQVYVPPRKEVPVRTSKGKKAEKKLKRFKTIIDNTFAFHYDTEGLQKHMTDIKPDDEVYISVKIHGSSFIAANILTNLPTPWYKRLWRKYIQHLSPYMQDYDLVYASRHVIKNEYINPKQKPGGYYSDDIWGYWAQKIKGLIPKDYEVYGEIVGYGPTGIPIQTDYDYGCLPNTENPCKLMIYRITHKGKELDIPEVIRFGNQLKEQLGDCIMEFPLMYVGTLKALYPEVPVDNHWHENVLEKLKIEKRFLMEENEPLCNNKVPREGFVLRKANDSIAEAWKLKCFNFLSKESKRMDKGEVDSEMLEGYESDI